MLISGSRPQTLAFSLALDEVSKKLPRAFDCLISLSDDPGGVVHRSLRGRYKHFSLFQDGIGFGHTGMDSEPAKTVPLKSRLPVKWVRAMRLYRKGEIGQPCCLVTKMVTNNPSQGPYQPLQTGTLKLDLPDN